MSEQQMRMRVFRFLKARMRNMIMPATVGIGLAVAGGCTQSDSTPVYSAPMDALSGPDAVYSAPLLQDASDTKQDAPTVPDLAKLDAPKVADTAADVGRDVASPEDAPTTDALAGETGADTRRYDAQGEVPWVKYGSPFDAGILDAQTEAGQIIAKYIAPIPDAGIDATDPVVRYMASMPDAARDLSVMPLYMAPIRS